MIKRFIAVSAVLMLMQASWADVAAGLSATDAQSRMMAGSNMLATSKAPTSGIANKVAPYYSGGGAQHNGSTDGGSESPVGTGASAEMKMMGKY